MIDLRCVLLLILAPLPHPLHSPIRYGGRFGSTSDARVDAAYRIIADHVRMMSIAIADGLLPSGKGQERLR